MDQMRGKTAAPEETRDDLQEILKRTSLVVFFANQLRLLEFVGLDGPSERNIENIATHLKDWSRFVANISSPPPARRRNASFHELLH